MRLIKKLRKLFFHVNEVYLRDVDPMSRTIQIYCLPEDPDFQKIEIIRLGTNECKLFIPKGDTYTEEEVIAMLEVIRIRLNNLSIGVGLDRDRVNFVIDSRINALKGGENED